MYYLLSLNAVSKKELAKWNTGFLADYPLGNLKKSDFENIFRNWFPFGDSKKLALYIFSKFDSTDDGVVDFQDFILLFSIFSKGSFEDRLNLIFKMYDMDEDGYIGRAELEYQVEIQSMAVGDLVQESIETQDLFDKLDSDRDGKISFQEFKNGVSNDLEICKAFNMYSG